MIEWTLSASLATAAVAVATGGVVTAFVRRTLDRATQVARTSQANHYEVCEGFAELAAANAALRRQVEQLAQRVEQSSRTTVVQQPPVSARAYELAARLAAGGAGSEELVTSCGLSPAEAELAVLVHGARPQRTPATTH